jgi:hypothetical protein
MRKDLLRYFLIASLLTSQDNLAKAEQSKADEVLNGKLLTCFAYSLHTIPLLNRLQQQVKEGNNDIDTQELIKAVGGKNKIQLALFDAEAVLDALSKLVSERHIIQIDQKLFDHPLWKLSNSIHDEWVKRKTFKEEFLGTFKFTQSCIDQFFKQSSQQ